ncbi:MAG: hypothetical protein WDM89_01040 [Rhizomicrobium sp.]
MHPGRCGGRAKSTLVFSDIHFEKGSFYALSGQFLPPYDTRTALKRIATAMAKFAPRRVIALGRLLSRPVGARPSGRKRTCDAGRARQPRGLDLDHGQSRSAAADMARRVITSEIAFGRLVFRHEPSVMAYRGEVAGHFHPCTTVSRRGRSLRRRCFVSDGTRIVMPAFGAYAGGLDLWDAAIASLFQSDFGAYVLGQTRVYAVKGRGNYYSARRNSSDESQPSNMAMNTVDTP